ncbi:MAG: hypothetical protein ABEJ87_02515 [Candidatus Nanohalobium sp.]
MSFHYKDPVFPARWENYNLRTLTRGIDTETLSEVDTEEEFGQEAQLNYEVDINTTNPPNADEADNFLSRDEDIDEDGFFYNIDITETLDTGEKEIGRDEISNSDLDSGLLGVHITGYRDSTGEDYLFHSDPKIWNPDKDPEKFTGEEKPQLPRTTGDDYFSLEGAYEFTEGLEEVSSYIQDVKELEGENTLRWEGLGRAVDEFQNRYEEGKEITG